MDYVNQESMEKLADQSESEASPTLKERKEITVNDVKNIIMSNPVEKGFSVRELGSERSETPSVCLPAQRQEIKICEAQMNEEDAYFIFKLRNEPETVKMSFSPPLVIFKDFYDIYLNKYFANIIPPLIATYGGHKIGFIGMKMNSKNVYYIGVSLDPEYRGKRLSEPMLLATFEYLRKWIFFNTDIIFPIIVIAEIKECNIKSVKLFEKVGFRWIENVKINNEPVHRYSFELSL